MPRMSWKVDPSILGLMFITVDVGVSGMSANAAGVPADIQMRGIVETVAIGSAAAYLSKSWWPIAAPVAYLAFDYLWTTRRGHAPEVLASETPDDYANGVE